MEQKNQNLTNDLSYQFPSIIRTSTLSGFHSTLLNTPRSLSVWVHCPRFSPSCLFSYSPLPLLCFPPDSPPPLAAPWLPPWLPLYPPSLGFPMTIPLASPFPPCLGLPMTTPLASPWLPLPWLPHDYSLGFRSPRWRRQLRKFAAERVEKSSQTRFNLIKNQIADVKASENHIIESRDWGDFSFTTPKIVLKTKFRNIFGFKFSY